MEPAAMPRPSAAPDPGSSPPADAGDRRAPRRKLRNYLLDSGLQLRLASYLVGAATLLSIGLGWLLWSAYRETSRVVALGDPEADSIVAALAAEDRVRIGAVAVALAVVLVCLLAAAVVVTHRIAGPAFVLQRTCQQIADGSLARPRPLRNRDLLVDLAEAVGSMVDALRDREAGDRAAMLHAAAMLRDPAADEDARAAAAAVLERIAADKGARLAS